MKTAKLFGLGALLFALVAVGCDKSTTTSPDSKNTPDPKAKKGDGRGADDNDDHDHGPGPHGGTIIELGKYHGEFVVDHKKKEATVYILSGNLKNAVPLKADKAELTIKKPMFQVELKPMPLEGEEKGSSSRFVATHDNFGVEQEFEGAVIIKVGDKTYDGDFKEKADKDEKK